MKKLFDEIRPEAKSILEKYPVLFAYLYGSSAEEKHTPLSDIDIGLVLSVDVSASEYLDVELSIEAELGRRLPLRELDVRVINNAPLRFKAQVVQTGKLLFSRDESQRVEFETSVRDQYFDFQPKIEEARDAFFHKIKKEGLRG